MDLKVVLEVIFLKCALFENIWIQKLNNIFKSDLLNYLESIEINSEIISRFIELIFDDVSILIIQTVRREHSINRFKCIYSKISNITSTYSQITK